MSEPMVQADGLVKIYKTRETEVLALQGLDLTVETGELTQKSVYDDHERTDPLQA